MAVITCLDCKYSKEVADDLIGKKMKCRKCGGISVVKPSIVEENEYGFTPKDVVGKRPSDGGPTVLISVIPSLVSQVSEKMQKALVGFLSGEDLGRFSSPATSFELEVYNLFKVDYSICGEVSEDSRMQIIEACESAIAVQFQAPKLNLNATDLSRAIASRMDSYGERSGGKSDIGELLITLGKKCVQNLLALDESGIEVVETPPLVISGNAFNNKLLQLLMECEQTHGGMHFFGSCMKLFRSRRNIFNLNEDEVLAEF